MPGLPEDLQSFMKEMRERDTTRDKAWERRLERTDKEWERRLTERDGVWEKRLETIQGRNEELSQENIRLQTSVLEKMDVIERLESRVEQLISAANDQAKMIVGLSAKCDDLSAELTNVMNINKKMESDLMECLKKNTGLEKRVQKLLESDKELRDTVDRMSRGKWSKKSKVFLTIAILSIVAGVGLMTAGLCVAAPIGVGLIIGAGATKCAGVGFAAAAACYK